MRTLLIGCILLVLGACSGSDDTGTTCPSLGSAGGNDYSDPAFTWSQTKCACAGSMLGTAAGGSCKLPKECAATCCTCPGDTGWTFTARACMGKTCLDQTACQVTLAADPNLCKPKTAR